MSTFRDIVASDRDAILLNLDELAETISYTPAGGIATDVVAHVLRQGITDDTFGDGRKKVELLTVCVSADVIATVSVGDTVLVDSKRYVFGQLIETTGMRLHRIQFKRKVVIEKSAQEYRLDT